MLGKPQKDFFSGRTTKRGGGWIKAGPQSKKELYLKLEKKSENVRPLSSGALVV